MEHSRIEDWTVLPGIPVQIRLRGKTVCKGTVDCITPDGTILWIHQDAGGRRLIERAEGYEVWANMVTLGMAFRNARTGTGRL